MIGARTPVAMQPADTRAQRDCEPSRRRGPSSGQVAYPYKHKFRAKRHYFVSNLCFSANIYARL